MRNIISPLTSSSPWGRLGGASMVNQAGMNKLLLQKVEELTLYVIEKDKEVKGLKADRKELEVEMQKMKDEFEAIKKLILSQ
ncbi:hypothetical protein SAMN06265379_101947 [Saccharicrinis carchari]|uniref:Uncharacterized protein n=1 Tax=Saccharicrinis carchari TaxID=1168039 RepID=A0A521BJ52_SACCC|nr:hypothetical protein [Saccharicrinis carchari]SMO46700.1 hypothetical protein SAMN06265379_101947 [Saccharicrinis carchari]